MWDIISGKRFGDNRVINLISEKPYSIGRELRKNGLAGTNLAFAGALLIVLPQIARQFFRDSKIPEFLEIGKNPNQDVLERYSAYMAWFVQYRWIDRNEDAIKNDDGVLDEVGQSLLEDMEVVRKKLFPDEDPAVQEAIGRTRDNDQRAIQPIEQDRSDIVNEESWLILASLLGVNAPPKDDYKGRRERAYAIAGMMIATLQEFTYKFEQLLEEPTLLEAVLI